MRILPVLLACVAVTALTACGGEDTSTNDARAAAPKPTDPRVPDVSCR
ncbi:hypothetical protein [Micromonospora sp. AKA38]|nr:hypothetical protein [Micromonospora sp. AKA38]